MTCNRAGGEVLSNSAPLVVPKKLSAHVRHRVNMPGVGLPVRTAVAGIVGVSLAAAVGWHNREFMPAGWKPW